MSQFGNAFGDAVRSTARLRQSVAAGTIGAVAACTMAFGAMAADSTYAGARAIPEASAGDAGAFGAGQRDLTRQSADFYLRGLETIGESNLNDLGPREAILTLKAMARNVLANGPKAAPDPLAPGARILAVPGLDTMTNFLDRLSDQNTLTAPMAQEEAQATAQKARELLGLAGIEAGPSAFNFDGVVKEMGRSASSKTDALREIKRMASDPNSDVAELVKLAQAARFERSPADSVLLSRMADRFVAKGGLDLGERELLARDASISQAADGALAAIEQLWKEEGASLDKGLVGRTATRATHNIDAIARPFDGFAMASAPKF
jgi:hypothetical protein